MATAPSNASKKIDEAHFYLQLMTKIEVDRQSLTDKRDPAAEFSYLLSAFLNACYSTTEYLKQNQENINIIKQFRTNNSDFYGHGPNGGWRTKVVHFQNIEPTLDGYIPPPGNNVILLFQETKQTEVRSNNSANPIFGPGKFYFSDKVPQNSICELCTVHLGQLSELINSCD